MTTNVAIISTYGNELPIAEAVNSTGEFKLSFMKNSKGWKLPRAKVAGELAEIEHIDVVVMILGLPRDRGKLEDWEKVAQRVRNAAKPLFFFVAEELLSEVQQFLEFNAITTFSTSEQLSALLMNELTAWRERNNTRSDEFELTFSKALTKAQIRASLDALADYFRACGGVGLRVEFDSKDVLVSEPGNVLV